MLDSVTYDQLAPYVGSTFQVTLKGGGSVELTLEKAGKVMESEAARLARNPFSLFFTGPKEPFLDQSMYEFRHEAFGPEPAAIFIVPIGKTASGFRYEAVFT